jgi:outer membrane immunogenic protein
MHRLVAASLTAAGLSVGLTAAASAADLGRPAPAPVYTKAPVVAPSTWTGFYIGGNVGGVSEHASGTSDFLDTSPAAVGFAANPEHNSKSNTSFIGGAQLGYNWQVSHVVLGAEGDWDWMHSKYSFCRDTDSLSVPCIDKGLGFETIGSETNWLATARGRLGVTVPNFSNVMIFGTGGAAFASVKTTEALSCLVLGCGGSSLKLAASSDVTQTKTGWTAGAGVEAMLSRNWSVKAEWLHVDLGTLNNTFATTGSLGTQSVSWSRTEQFEVFRAGVNYRFQ